MKLKVDFTIYDDVTLVVDILEQNIPHGLTRYSHKDFALQVMCEVEIDYSNRVLYLIGDDKSTTASKDFYNPTYLAIYVDKITECIDAFNGHEGGVTVNKVKENK